MVPLVLLLLLLLLLALVEPLLLVVLEQLVELTDVPPNRLTLVFVFLFILVLIKVAISTLHLAILELVVITELLVGLYPTFLTGVMVSTSERLQEVLKDSVRSIITVVSSTGEAWPDSFISMIGTVSLKSLRKASTILSRRR
jgi:hypothetical protein